MQERKMMDLFRLKFKGLENAGLKIERPKLRDFLKTLLNPSWSVPTQLKAEKHLNGHLLAEVAFSLSVRSSVYCISEQINWLIDQIMARRTSKARTVDIVGLRSVNETDNRDSLSI